MWDPVSGVKFATNEPLRPHFRDSQIYKFVDDNQGPGVQHVAFNVQDIIWHGRGAEAPRASTSWTRPRRTTAISRAASTRSASTT